MISIYTEADTSQCSLTEVESGNDTSRKMGFLQLPLELRQRVYRELLVIYKTSGRFETSILRVTKGIHDEAVKIFYGENGFIMFHVHRKVLGQLRLNDLHDFPSTFALIPVTGAVGGMGSEPALTVSIALQHSCSSILDSQWQDEWERYVGIPMALSRLCRIITCCHIRNTLHLRLSLPSVEYHTLEGRPDRLLENFHECRGVGTAEILSAEGSPVKTDLSFLMTQPLELFDEILVRGRYYQSQVRRQLVRQNRLETLRTLATAENFFLWWCLNGFELSNETDEKWTEFWDMKLETSLIHAFQTLQYGEPKNACQVTRRIWGTRPLKYESAPIPRRLWDKESECHYILGLCSLFEDCKICALYEFLHALISMPGNEKVDKEIDKLEAAIEHSDIPDDEIILWNIKHVLQRFRHQPLLDPSLDANEHKHRGPADMTADDQYKLEDSFVQSFAHLAACKLTRYPRR